MGLTNLERETIIILNDEESTAWVSTASPVWIRRMGKLAEENPEVRMLMRNKDSDHEYVRYEVPKKWVKVRKPRMVSEEQKLAASERMRFLHSKRSATLGSDDV